MPSNVAKRTLLSLSRQARNCECGSVATSRAAASVRQFSASTSRREIEQQTDGEQRPRWSYTPEKMRAPFRVRLHDNTKPWECNSDPARLDKFYRNLLGPGGENVLSDEVKWLAVTHKSFEQGARGFNDRLAYFGRRILNTQVTQVLLNSTTATQSQSLVTPDDDREPFQHPALEGLENLTNLPVGEVLTKARLARFGAQMEMPAVIRWRPRMPDRLEASGIDVVLATTLYAIIGAVGLQRGGAVAATLARERVLKPMGIS